MPHDVKQYLKWLGIVALVIIVGNLLASCSRPIQTAPVPKTDTVVVSVPYVPLLPLLDTLGNPTAAGMTACDYQGHPVVYILPSMEANPFSKRYILAHEVVHVTDILKYGCAAFISKYFSDGDFKWDAEARAYCAAWNLMVLDGVANKAYWASVILRMRQYDTSLTDTEIPKYLPCRPP